MKILIVEDEPSLRELIQCSLEKERYVVAGRQSFGIRTGSGRLFAKAISFG